MLDLGCSGGIDPAFRVFALRLRALGIDASASECRRLVAAESHPDIHYRAAFVRMPPDYPDFGKFQSKPLSTHHPFERFSAYRTVQLIDERIRRSLRRFSRCPASRIPPPSF